MSSDLSQIIEYSNVVVGRGLFGCAAAKYLQKASSQTEVYDSEKVLLVGPTEFDTENNIYSSHNDQGRVVRLIGFDDYWTQLNVDAAAGFRSLEAETGLKIIHRTGCVTMCTATASSGHGNGGERSPYFANRRVQEAADKFQIGVQCAENNKAAAVDTFLRENGNFRIQSPPAKYACFEKGGETHSCDAGYLNIPNLKIAQQESFEKHGGVFNDKTVLKILKDTDPSNRRRLYEIFLSDGSIIRARNVVVCCGSFCNQHSLLPIERNLPLHLKTETVLTARLPENIAKEVSESMPSLLWEVETEDYEGPYMVPPMQYPDKNWYLKIGCNCPEDMHFDFAEQKRVDGRKESSEMWDQISRWFEDSAKESTKNQEQVLKARLREVLPDLYEQVLGFQTKRCIITRTPTGRPILEEVEPGLFVATGGNGYGAMASDAIGKRIADMVLNSDAVADMVLNSDVDSVKNKASYISRL